MTRPGWEKEPYFLWRLSSAHGSRGTLGDLGIHILDFATLVANAFPACVSCLLTTIDKAPGGKIGEYVLDANDSFSMQLTLENGSAGVIHSSRFASGHHNDLFLAVHGTKGALRVSDFDGISQLSGSLGSDVESRQWSDIPFDPVPNLFQKFITAIETGQGGDPDFDRGSQLQKVLDAAMQSHRQACRCVQIF